MSAGRVKHLSARRCNVKRSGPKTEPARAGEPLCYSPPVFKALRDLLGGKTGVVLGLLLVITASPLSAASAGALQYEVLPLIRSSQNHLLVRAQINGKPALLGVDTGA